MCARLEVESGGKSFQERGKGSKSGEGMEAVESRKTGDFIRSCVSEWPRPEAVEGGFGLLGCIWMLNALGMMARSAFLWE